MTQRNYLIGIAALTSYLMLTIPVSAQAPAVLKKYPSGTSGLTFNKKGEMFSTISGHDTHKHVIRINNHGVTDTVCTLDCFAVQFLRCAPDGSLYLSQVTERGKSAVLLKISGRKPNVISEGFVQPVGIAFDRKRNIYLADAMMRKIFRISPAGKKSVFIDLDSVKEAKGILYHGLDFNQEKNSLFIAGLSIAGGEGNILRFDIEPRSGKPLNPSVLFNGNFKHLVIYKKIVFATMNSSELFALDLDSKKPEVLNDPLFNRGMALCTGTKGLSSKKLFINASDKIITVDLPDMDARNISGRNPPEQSGYMPSNLPRIITPDTLSVLAGNMNLKTWGFIGRDYSELDFTNVPVTLMVDQAFDTETRWPESKLPVKFDPEAFLETGKNPGLGIRQLHREGITGKGVSVAIIDKPINFKHSEFKGRITYTEVFDEPEARKPMHFHGIACASILAGKTTGVAPGARIFYFAVQDNGNNFLNYAHAVEKLLVINRTLKPEDRIRIVSISDGYIGQFAKEWEAAKEKLRAEGVDYVYAGPDVFSGFPWGGCPPYLDREIPEYYEISSYLKSKGAKKGLIVPADYRTTAGNHDNKAYTYWGTAGLSWAIPYVAGLSALAWQVNPKLRYPEIKELLFKTSMTKPDGAQVINPRAFIEAVEKTSLKCSPVTELSLYRPRAVE